MAKRANSGSWKPGQSGNPNGRPKKGHTLTDAMRELLEAKRQDPSKAGRSVQAKKLFVESVYHRAVNGDPTAMKLLWNYVDGMPEQKFAGTIEHGGSIVIEQDSALDAAIKRQPQGAIGSNGHG